MPQDIVFQPQAPPAGLGDIGPVWLDAEHPIYAEWKEAWRTNERRARGGKYVADELQPFEWEPVTSDHYKCRQGRAVYLNFADDFATIQTGHLQREAPQPDAGLSFGSLGEVQRRGAASIPTRAELLYYNATGNGNDGSGWDSFWFGALKRAHHTGHRWILVDSPPAPAAGRARSFADEIAGQRPYLVEYSPLAVTDWFFERGTLQYAILRTPAKRTNLITSTMTGSAAGAMYKSLRGYLVLVRRGYEGFGEGWSQGGWWQFAADRTLAASGTFDSTDGQIPLFPLYYERDDGMDDEPAMSRPGTTEIAAAAVAYMNLAAAADFDAWDAAGSVTIINGADPEQAKAVAAQKASGSRFVFIPPAQGAAFAATGGAQPTVADASMGAVAADIFDKRLAQKREEVAEISAREASGAPDSSGVSKRVGFGEKKSPRLAHLANNLEEAQNTALYFVERRWGVGTPSGSVTWPREFDLQDVIDGIRAQLDLQAIAGAQSPTLTAKLLTRAAKENGLETDDAILKTAEAEYLDSAQSAVDVQKQSKIANQELDSLLGPQGGQGLGSAAVGAA